LSSTEEALAEEVARLKDRERRVREIREESPLKRMGGLTKGQRLLIGRILAVLDEDSQ